MRSILLRRLPLDRPHPTAQEHRIVSQFFISLDGVVGRPDLFHFPYFDDDMSAIMTESLSTSRAVLMGRRLHDEWAAYWPGKTEKDDEFAGFINPIARYVLSSTLTSSPWEGTTVLPGSAAEIEKLKQQIDGDITMSGSAITVRWLLGEGLLDELNLLVDPVLVGTGQRLFEDGTQQGLQLTSSRALGTGVLHLRYAPAAER